MPSREPGVVYYADGSNFKPLAKEAAPASGRAKFSAKIKGAHAAVRFPEGQPLRFRLCSADPTRYKVYRLLRTAIEQTRLLRLSRQSWASESIPFLPSMASIPTKMRSCGVIWIRTLTPVTHGSASPDKTPTRSSPEYATCRDAPPVPGAFRNRLRPRRHQFHKRRQGRCRRFRSSLGHPLLQMVPLHTQFGRSPVDAFLPGHLDSRRP